VVDIFLKDEALVRVYYACDTDAPEGAYWLTFIIKSTRPGLSSPRPLKQRLQDLINKTPALMEKAFQDAWLSYQAALLSWNEGKNPKMPKKPVMPVKPVPDFKDVPLSRRVAWLQYGDFDDEGIDLIEVFECPPSDLMSHDACIAVE
jgi:hypothetical protein